jgi:hypothetical protein
MTENMDYAQEQALKILEASYEMYEKTKKETERRMEDDLNPDGSKKFTRAAIDDKLRQIQEAQDDIIKEYIQTGGNVDDLKNRKPKKKKGVTALKEFTKTKTTKTTNTKKDTTINTKKTTMTTNKKTAEKDVIEENRNEAKTVYIPKKREYNPNVQFDIIPLPSKGQPYKHKVDRLQVAYLTANDENMFVSPNLYRDGLLIDFLLNEKIMEAGIDPSELLDGDRDAIILWLRATGYGNEFPITAKDNQTGTEFDAVVDLSKIEFKEFNLKSDDNGWFDFELPLSKDVVKFKFLNHRETDELKNNEIIENVAAIKDRLSSISDELRRYLDNDTTLIKAQKSKLYEACRNIDDWNENLEDDGMYYSQILTNTLISQVMSINGNTNRGLIENYIENMNVRDSLALRKYISNNEPGLNFELEIEKPESLGGGSQKVFLPFDNFIFLNIA